MKIQYEKKQNKSKWSLKCCKQNINPTMCLKIGFNLEKYTRFQRVEFNF